LIRQSRRPSKFTPLPASGSTSVLLLLLKFIWFGYRAMQKSCAPFNTNIYQFRSFELCHIGLALDLDSFVLSPYRLEYLDHHILGQGQFLYPAVKLELNCPVPVRYHLLVSRRHYNGVEIAKLLKGLRRAFDLMQRGLVIAIF